MIAPNITYLWSSLIIEELVRCGVTRFCISPGYRNTPLVLAAAENPGVDSTIHVDERGAAFYAIGYAKACGKPVALICTSGTAVANYFPAIIEASQSTTPLIVLTADRPIELRDTGANQTIDQVDIYGRYSRWSVDLPKPSAAVSADFILTTVDQAAYRARRAPAGPVHLNCQFAEPLTPEQDDSIPTMYRSKITGWENDVAPYTEYAQPRIEPTVDMWDNISNMIAESRRGIIVAGCLGAEQDSAITSVLSKDLKMPLLACVSSGLRFSREVSDNLISTYDLILRDSRISSRLRPDLILHLGGPIVSRTLAKYVENSGARYIVVNETPFRQDAGHCVSVRIEMDPGSFCRGLRGYDASGESELLPLFKQLDSICTDELNSLHAASSITNEFAVARELLKLIPSDCGLFLANSMPVRDADGCGFKTSRSISVGVNRGASGIDGNIASAVGFAQGLERRTVLLIGDLAFLHDLNSLFLVRQSQYPMTIVLINNNGGGIFSLLPIADQTERFETFFGTPHGVDVQHASSLFDIHYSRARSTAEFISLCQDSFAGGKSSIIEVRTDRQQNAKEHRDIWDRVSDAIGKHFRQD
ncbi:MAG: 2-succinyl-5-enolpyruvyl-6-hydroxy-3-cyclohexene-1-carboxylic-acid synthase [candidate division Zixibacteria bacterium]|nr:2-succinyl-5-enolpyruvyl-6-hydroxy-3-cyclohexene-1-carboxylic-acid synthase [candidate division Zixibacteria bacterium]MBU1469328.1 2-succinyl-5-enolpyruvyl-6-hydroxy-3-cyclohexene-1-carboxylic-acid synthase [candidate division Zixibacteria bacterium]MBU2626388.1 2-succinyl-5-enolpyruvyl-6-hydroxy-3-cyclohexene-1-carboxylic-acid synthase [candidate division Zixibacteria bacterium]